MCTEFKSMEDTNAWGIINRKDLPMGRKLIGNCWVYTLKDKGRNRAKSVAKGFRQAPGNAFQEYQAPVVNETTFHSLKMEMVHKENYK
jgi:hypothetical protein